MFYRGELSVVEGGILYCIDRNCGLYREELIVV